MDLEKIRQEIDVIDRQLVRLLEDRMALVSQVATYKKKNAIPIFDPRREEELLEKVNSLVIEDTYRQTIRCTFYDIMKNSRDYQAEQLGR